MLTPKHSSLHCVAKWGVSGFNGRANGFKNLNCHRGPWSPFSKAGQGNCIQGSAYCCTSLCGAEYDHHKCQAFNKPTLTENYLNTCGRFVLCSYPSFIASALDHIKDVVIVNLSFQTGLISPRGLRYLDVTWSTERMGREPSQLVKYIWHVLKSWLVLHWA